MSTRENPNFHALEREKRQSSGTERTPLQEAERKTRKHPDSNLKLADIRTESVRKGRGREEEELTCFCIYNRGTSSELGESDPKMEPQRKRKMVKQSKAQTRFASLLFASLPLSIEYRLSS